MERLYIYCGRIQPKYTICIIWVDDSLERGQSVEIGPTKSGLKIVGEDEDKMDTYPDGEAEKQ